MQTHCEPLELREDEGGGGGGKSVSKTYLVNKLNYLNFQDETISVCFRHHKYDNPISVTAKPMPCAGERLDCAWVATADLQQVLTAYRFDHLLFNDGKTFLMVTPKVLAMDREGLSVQLPLNGREFKVRKIRRHHTAGIGVQMTQDGALFQGTLADFTPVSLRVEGKVASPQTFKWLDIQAPVNLQLYQGKHILYSGSCRIARHSYRDNHGTFVLNLTSDMVQRFSHHRSWDLPQRLFPSPNMLFAHPLIGKIVSLKVAEISGWTFSAEESEDNSVLMPGMVIPELKLSFGHDFDITCKAQVVSREVVEGAAGEPVASCVLSILDMDIHEHVKLLSILQQANDKNSYICNSVDMDALWDFFFETGFVYPKKYAYFQANKEKIKKTYHRLYTNNPHIARHFIYQDKGEILGHVSMLRFFENSWMIHHHAARKTVSLKAGMTVLHQISHYVHVLRNFHFAHLDYVYCYYRPDNKFPNRVFGGFAKELAQQKGCSLDPFAFSHFNRDEVDCSLSSPWELKPSCPFDLSELASFYGYTSGGLMIDAFGLDAEGAAEDKVAKEYQKLGFKKEKQIYSLCCEGLLKAVILTNSTDAGLNMANLTNCMTLLVLDETLPLELLRAALKEASQHYEENEIPVLIYPFSFAEKSSFPFEKTYMLWILNLHYLDQYRDFTQRLFRGLKRSDPTEPEPSAP